MARKRPLQRAAFGHGDRGAHGRDRHRVPGLAAEPWTVGRLLQPHHARESARAVEEDRGGLASALGVEAEHFPRDTACA